MNMSLRGDILEFEKSNVILTLSTLNKNLEVISEDGKLYISFSGPFK